MDTAAGIAKLKDLSVRVYVVATGAGAGIQNALWRVPGASAFLVGASFPYEAAETDELLGFAPRQYASPETALDLAMEAYRRAAKADSSQGAVGLALTASVASVCEHRGEHRIHVAVVTDQRVIVANELLPKGAGDEARKTDGDASDHLGLHALFAALEIEPQDEGSPFHRADDEARRQFFERPAFSHGRRTSIEPLMHHSSEAIFPGAFDPPHQAHHEIARLAGGALFAVCANPSHKAALTLQDMLRRSNLFLPDERVSFTENDPLFIDKARKFPGCPIVIGADALLRMLDPAWGPAIEPMLAEFAQLETTFKVFGRLLNGEYVSGEHAIEKVPRERRGMFTAIAGRWDISSTDVRTHRTA